MKNIIKTKSKFFTGNEINLFVLIILFFLIFINIEMQNLNFFNNFVMIIAASKFLIIFNYFMEMRFANFYWKLIISILLLMFLSIFFIYWK